MGGAQNIHTAKISGYTVTNTYLIEVFSWVQLKIAKTIVSESRKKVPNYT